VLKTPWKRSKIFSPCRDAYVGKSQMTKEQFQTEVFNVYTRYRDNSSSDHRQAYFGQLWDLLRKYYFKKEANEIGYMLYMSVCRLIEKDFKNEIDFIKYLQETLKNTKTEHYRQNNTGSIRISREKKRKLREVEDFIMMKESNLGRKLTADEQIQSISKWFKNQEYVDLLTVINVGSISHISNDNNEMDILDSTVTSPYLDSISDDPFDEYINKTDMETVRKIVKSLIEKKQERSRDCYRALFTLHCIENMKDFEILAPVLDSQILETWHKSNKKPNQYEIYQIYHPNTQKSSAGSTATTNLRDFLKEIEICLKEKNQ
jgi:hypothetical protein